MLNLTRGQRGPSFPALLLWLALFAGRKGLPCSPSFPPSNPEQAQPRNTTWRLIGGADDFGSRAQNLDQNGMTFHFEFDDETAVITARRVKMGAPATLDLPLAFVARMLCTSYRHHFVCTVGAFGFMLPIGKTIVFKLYLDSLPIRNLQRVPTERLICRRFQAWNSSLTRRVRYPHGKRRIKVISVVGHWSISTAWCIRADYQEDKNEVYLYGENRTCKL